MSLVGPGDEVIPQTEVQGEPLIDAPVILYEESVFLVDVGEEAELGTDLVLAYAAYQVLTFVVPGEELRAVKQAAFAFNRTVVVGYAPKQSSTCAELVSVQVKGQRVCHFIDVLRNFRRGRSRPYMSARFRSRPSMVRRCLPRNRGSCG